MADNDKSDETGKNRSKLEWIDYFATKSILCNL